MLDHSLTKGYVDVKHRVLLSFTTVEQKALRSLTDVAVYKNNLGKCYNGLPFRTAVPYHDPNGSIHTVLSSAQLCTLGLL